MPENKTRKYLTRVDYLSDFPGADIARNLIKIALAAQDVTFSTEGTLNLTEVAGESLTAADWTAIFQSLLKDSKIPAAVQQDASGAIYIVLKTDNIGLLKDSKIPSALQQDSAGAIYVLTKDDAMARFKAHDYSIQSTEIYFIDSGSYWAVNDLTNDGRLIDDGTLYVFGSLGGSGVVEGTGTIVLR